MALAFEKAWKYEWMALQNIWIQAPTCVVLNFSILYWNVVIPPCVLSWILKITIFVRGDRNEKKNRSTLALQKQGTKYTFYESPVSRAYNDTGGGFLPRP